MTVQDYTVLLADPDARMRTLLANQLAPLGCRVLQADTGESAMALVNGGQVRLVVSEMYMKTSNDDCLIHAIRQMKALNKTRTVALTRHATSADRDQAMQSGADAYLIKPTRAERFRYVVGRVATGTRPSTRTRAANAGPAKKTETGNGATTPQKPESPYKNK